MNVRAVRCPDPDASAPAVVVTTRDAIAPGAALDLRSIPETVTGPAHGPDHSGSPRQGSGQPAPLSRRRSSRRPGWSAAPTEGTADARPGMGRVWEARPLGPVEQWAGALAVAASEVLTGSRQVQQLTRWVGPEIYAALARRSGLLVRLRGRPTTPMHARLLAIRAVASHAEAVPVTPARRYEVSALVHDGRRLRAIAARVEQHHGRWRATALEIG